MIVVVDLTRGAILGHHQTEKTSLIPELVALRPSCSGSLNIIILCTEENCKNEQKWSLVLGKQGIYIDYPWPG